MHDWLPYLMPVAAGIFSFVGAFAAVRTDLSWIKDTLARHEGDIRAIRNRITGG